MSHLAKIFSKGCLALLLSCFWISPQARADIILLEAYLDGLQETPPNASPGNGYGFMTYDTDSMLFSWKITYQDLLGTITAAHFHGPADFGVPAGVQVGIGALPSPMIGSTTLNQTFEDQLLDNKWYINIHTNLFAGGEIRGQVQVIPEVNSLALTCVVVSAAGAAGWLRRRKVR